VLTQAGEPFDLVELPYPKAPSYDALLSRLEETWACWEAEHPESPVYATGIGGLVALSLRARGALASNPLVIQGAVLWGLERRWFPRLMRLPGMPRLLVRAFRNECVRARFSRRHFLTQRDPEWSRRFFAGYGDAEAFACWVRWLTPALLRRLERELAARPGALDSLEAWWGAADSVVGVEELRVTERALGVRIPLRTFASRGHYPMIDDPKGWVAEVSRVVETAGALS
jgi:hypothetical protein